MLKESAQTKNSPVFNSSGLSSSQASQWDPQNS